MNEHVIRKVVIVGGGAPGWMAAAALARFLNNGSTRITVVEPREGERFVDEEASLPSLAHFHRMLGLDETDILAATDGTFRLGTEFSDWGALGERYFHPFGSHGQDIQGVHFHQLWLRERTRAPTADIAAWSLAAVAAASGKFARSAADDRSPLRDLRHSWHLNAALYGCHLRDYAVRAGVVAMSGEAVDVAMRPTDGYVQAIGLADGREVEGDLFVDCSGPRALLIGEALGAEYESYARWLSCDRMVSAPCSLPHTEAPEPFTRATARSAGWQWRVPLRDRLGNGLVYSSRDLDDDDAEAQLLASLEGDQLAEPLRTVVAPGRRREAWSRNVVALGSAAGAIEPLEAPALHLVQAAIQRLIPLFPDKRFNPIERAEFNRQMGEVHEGARDFTILHYMATRRNDSVFWDRMRSLAVPESLQRGIDLFAGKARLFREGEDQFGTASWVAVCLGQGIIPEHWEPAAEALDADKVAVALEQMRRAYAETVQRLPTHGEYLRLVAPRSAGASMDTRFDFSTQPQFDATTDGGSLL